MTTPPGASPFIGRTLGRYRITAKLGEGGMGTVWRAEDPALGRIVALKLLSPALWESDTARQRFVREARAASQLDHPNIATVYDVGETDGHAWIAYQFVDGETVAARTARGPLPIAEAVALALGTAEALAHAHERGVLHRDVTAGNVMVTREGGPPEAVYYRVLNERVPPPSEVRPELPSSLERVVMKLLEREPADRYASAAEAIEALREVSPEQAPTPSEQARRRAARRLRHAGDALRRVGRVRVGMAALASVALLAAAVWFAAQRGWVPGFALKPPTLAVLPFRNETDDPEATRYIAEGLAEALATDLAQTERMQVLPWVTTQRVDSDSTSLPKLARDLNANWLLLGTLRSAGDGLTLSLALVNGQDGRQKWARRFEGEADQLPAMQAQILFEAAMAMLGKLTPGERTRMALPSGRDGRAYNLYLEGAALLRAGDPASTAMAEQFFERSLELDSTLAEAHVELGAVYNGRYFVGAEGGARDFDIARRHFERASQLDPGSTLVMRALANLYWQQERREDCLLLALRAARTRPQTLDLSLVAAEAYVLGDLPDIGLGFAERVIAEDPSNPSARFWAVIGAAWSGNPEATLRHGAEYFRRFGEYYEVYLWMGLSALALGQTDKALALVHRAREMQGAGGDARPLLFVAAIEEITLGKQRARASWQELRRILSDRLELEPNQPGNLVFLMRTLIALEEHEQAMHQWRLLAPWVESPDQQGLNELSRLPLFLVRLREPVKARRVMKILERRGIYLTAKWDVGFLGLLDVSDDSLIAGYRARSEQNDLEMRARYGRP